MNNNDHICEINEKSCSQFREKRIKNALDWLRGILPENGSKSDLASVLELTVSYIDHFQSYMNKHNPDTLEEIREIFKNKIPAEQQVLTKRKLNKRQHSEALDDCVKKGPKHRKLEHHETSDDIFWVLEIFFFQEDKISAKI